MTPEEARAGGAGAEDHRDDRALLAAHVAGDPAAFGTLFARHRDRLWAVALRTTGNPEEAADALQDAMVSAFRRAGSYRGDAAVTTWLHRVVVNACLDRARRRAARPGEPLPDDLEERGTAPVPRETSSGSDPTEAAERSERQRAVLAALRTLPEEQRAALVLVDMEGYSVQEAADLLGVAAGTVKSRCSRGRARLLPLLAPLRSTGEPGEPRDPDRGNPDAPGPVQPRSTDGPVPTGGGEQP